MTKSEANLIAIELMEILLRVKVMKREALADDTIKISTRGCLRSAKVKLSEAISAMESVVEDLDIRELLAKHEQPTD